MEGKHVEYSRRHPSSDTVVVFIHGILGSPLQFDYLVEALEGTYSVENLLLPGHGKGVKEFEKSTMAQWQDYLDRRVRALQEAYENIYLVGHSMGCLLSVQTAVSYPRKIRGLFLTAMPLSVHFTYPYIHNHLLLAFGKGDEYEIIAAAKRLNSVSTSNPVAYLRGIPRYIELLGKIRATRALLDQLWMPVAVVQSAGDEIVSPKSLRYLENRRNIRACVVRDAGHFYYPQEIREEITRDLKEFVLGAG